MGCGSREGTIEEEGGVAAGVMDAEEAKDEALRLWLTYGLYVTADADADAAASHPPPARPRPRPPRSESRASRTSVTSSIFEGKGGWLWWKLPRWIRRPLGAWLDRFAMVLAPEWIRTTVVVWGVWFGMSLGGPSTPDRPIRG